MNCLGCILRSTRGILTRDALVFISLNKREIAVLTTILCLWKKVRRRLFTLGFSQKRIKIYILLNWSLF